jgi:copper homeostasis protein
VEHPGTQVDALSIDGLVMGFLNGTQLDVGALNNILSQVPQCRVTFHHAFEELADWQGGIDSLRQIRQVDRILTAGGTGPWPDRKRRLAEYSKHASPELQILAGGGMSAETIRQLGNDTQVREFHVGTAAREQGHVTRRRVEMISKLLSNPDRAQCWFEFSFHSMIVDFATMRWNTKSCEYGKSQIPFSNPLPCPTF